MRAMTSSIFMCALLLSCLMMSASAILLDQFHHYLFLRGDPEGKMIVLNHSYRLTPASRLTLYTQTPVHFAFMKLQIWESNHSHRPNQSHKLATSNLSQFFTATYESLSLYRYRVFRNMLRNLLSLIFFCFTLIRSRSFHNFVHGYEVFSQRLAMQVKRKQILSTDSRGPALFSIYSAHSRTRDNW